MWYSALTPSNTTIDKKLHHSRKKSTIQGIMDEFQLWPAFFWRLLYPLRFCGSGGSRLRYQWWSSHTFNETAGKIIKGMSEIIEKNTQICNGIKNRLIKYQKNCRWSFPNLKVFTAGILWRPSKEIARAIFEAILIIPKKMCQGETNPGLNSLQTAVFLRNEEDFPKYVLRVSERWMRWMNFWSNFWNLNLPMEFQPLLLKEFPNHLLKKFLK